MRPNKVLVVFGTRPETIKLAPVIRELESCPGLQPVVCVTAQHRQLVDQALRTFDLHPDYDLDVMRPDQSLCDVAARILQGVGTVIEKVSPSFMLVQGDTTTCLAASLAGFYAGVPIGHVEAGLRTGDLQAPFPEEANRLLVGRLAQLHFAPTEHTRANLLREGVHPSRIYVTGNTVIDALGIARSLVSALPRQALLDALGTALFDRLLKPDVPVVLITGHRRENLDHRLSDVAAAIRELAIKHSDWCFVYPVHLNPKARRPPHRLLDSLPNVFLTEPLEYLPFIWLMLRANAVVTDSGGLQEEATALSKPILITRDVTERSEALEFGGARLVGTRCSQLVAGVEDVILNPPKTPSEKARQVFGVGNAAKRIVEVISSTLIGETPPIRSFAESGVVTGKRRPPSAVQSLVSFERPGVTL